MPNQIQPVKDSTERLSNAYVPPFREPKYVRMSKTENTYFSPMRWMARDHFLRHSWNRAWNRKGTSLYRF